MIIPTYKQYKNMNEIFLSFVFFLYQAFGLWCVVLRSQPGHISSARWHKRLLNWTVKVLVPHYCEEIYLFNIWLPQLMENSLRTRPSPHWVLHQSGHLPVGWGMCADWLHHTHPPWFSVQVSTCGVRLFDDGTCNLHLVPLGFQVKGHVLFSASFLDNFAFNF